MVPLLLDQTTYIFIKIVFSRFCFIHRVLSDLNDMFNENIDMSQLTYFVLVAKASSECSGKSARLCRLV